MIKLHNREGFAAMRIAGGIAAKVLDLIGPHVCPGISTEKLDEICHQIILEHGATSACLNYRGFPKSVCTSVNHVVCHGIPDRYELQDGDIINIDVTVIYDDWHGDTSRMFLVGDSFIKKSARYLKAMRLVKCAYESMMQGIKQVRPGVPFSNIGRAIESHAKTDGFSVVREYCGHGIGKEFHCLPQVLNYYDPMDNIIIKAGMFFTIEPMINAGRPETKLSARDRWTVTTKDRSLSAQFEHTIGVNDTGCEIFTLSPSHAHYPAIIDEID